MKISLTLFFSLFLLSVYSQVSEQSASMSLGSQPAFVIEHDEADVKTAEKVVMKSIKKNNKFKFNRKAKEYYCENCKLSGMSEHMNIYVKFDGGDSSSKSYFFFDNGNEFVSSSEHISKRLKSLYYDVKRAEYQQQLEYQERTLKNKEKDLTKLEKENEKLHDSIADYEKKIEEANTDIETNLANQETKNGEIETQRGVVDEHKTKLQNVGK